MAQVNMPQAGGQSRGSKDTGTIFQLGGAIIGGIYGGPAGAVAGAGVGGAAAGLLESKDAGSAVSSGVQVGAGVQGMRQNSQMSLAEGAKQPGASPAMKRRLDTVSSDPLDALLQAESAAATLPESTRQRILPNLVQARMLEQRKRGTV